MMKPALRKLLAGGALVLLSMLLPAISWAQEAAGGGGGGKNQIIALAAAIAISIAAVGGGMGQGKAAASAFEGMARNPSIQPKIFTAMILALAFIESLVIYAMLISFLLMAKI